MRRLYKAFASCLCGVCITSGLLLATVLTGFAAGTAATPKILPAHVADPSRTAVLILPPVDATSTSPQLHPLHETVLVHRIEYEFLTRDFKMLGPEMAATAARSIRDLDLLSPNTRTSESLAALADKAHADWVVSVELDDLHNDSVPPSRWSVSAKINLRIYDAQRHGWIASRDFIGRMDAGAASAGPMMMNDGAIDNASKSALDSILASYRQVVHVEGEETSINYLAGQTEPFTGNPKKSFAGLNIPTTESHTSVEAYPTNRAN